jgi:hypothetical protein
MILPMKTPRSWLICLSFLLPCLLWAVESPPSFQQPYLGVWNITKDFPWMKNGDIFSYVIQPGVSLPSGQLAYVDRATGDGFFINGSLSAVSAVIRREHKSAVSETDIKTWLGKFLLFTLSQTRARILDDYYLKAYQGYLKNGGNEETFRVIKPLSVGMSTIAEGGKVRLTFNIITQYGAIENWVIEGVLQPFELTSILIISVRSQGSVVPLAEYGAG